MGHVELDMGDLFNLNTYLAAPRGLDVKEILAKDEGLKGKVFPYMPRTGNEVIEDVEMVGFKAMLDPEGDFTMLAVTYLPNDNLGRHSFHLPEGDLEKYTPLQITTTGKSKDEAYAVADRVQALFPDALDLEVVEAMAFAIQEVALRDLCVVEKKVPLFDKYAEMHKKMSGVKEMPGYRVLKDGPLVSLAANFLAKAGVEYSDDECDLKLVSGVKGNVDGLDVKLSLFFVSGRQMRSDIYGVVAAAGGSKEGSVIARPESFTGCFFLPKYAFVGGSDVTPVPSHGGYGGVVSVTDDASKLLEGLVDDFGRVSDMTLEHRAEIKKLAKVYGFDGKGLN